MIEKLKIKGNLNREKVLEYLVKNRYDLKYFKVQNCKEYSGGIELTDKKNRRIIIYYDEIAKSVKVLYKDLVKTDKLLKKEISDILWDYYSILAEQNKQVARFKRENGTIQFYLYDIKNTKNKTHISKKFSEVSQMYDIYYYLSNEIIRIKKEKVKNFNKVAN